jgi:MFS family permease
MTTDPRDGTAAGRPSLPSALARRLAPPSLGRDFRWLWASSAITNLGDGLLLSAGPLLVTTISREPIAVAASVFLQQLPWILFSVPAGAYIDRHDRRRLTMLVNALRAVVLAGLALSVATGAVTLPILFGAVFLIGTAETFADNAGSALIATTVPRPELGLANARLSGTGIVTNMVVGPSVGALAFGLGMALPFGLDAVCALAGAVLISRIAAPHVPTVRPEDRHLRREIAEGMRWLWRSTPVRALFLTIFFFNVTFGAAWSVLVLLATQRLGFDEFGYGLFITVGALGGLTGAAVYRTLERRFALSTIMRAGLLLETATHLILALTTSPVVACVTIFVFEGHAVVWGTTSTSIRQRAVPGSLMGRVTSIYHLGVIGGLAIGSLIGGLIAQVWGITGPFWFGFAGSALLLALIWRTLADIAHAPAADLEPAT